MQETASTNTVKLSSKVIESQPQKSENVSLELSGHPSWWFFVTLPQLFKQVLLKYD